MHRTGRWCISRDVTNENHDSHELGEALESAEHAKTRRRRLIQAAGGAVLGAAVITGAFSIPGLLRADDAAAASSGGVAVVQAGAPAAGPSPAAKPGATEDASRPNAGPGVSDQEEKALDKYFASGYDLGEGKKLQKLWKMQDKELIQVKAIAGQKLLDGEKLPVKPGYVVPADQPVKDKQVDAFFKEGYDYDDAAQLAKLWKLPSPYDAKVAGGKKILAGETLPIKP